MITAQVVLELATAERMIPVRIADDAEERAAGYQWICPEDASDTAVLFVFPKMFYSAFHMRNVFVPLDIFFFDGQGRQVGAMLMQAEPPGQGIKPRYYSPSAEFRYALEIPRSSAHDSTSPAAALSLVLESLPDNLE